MNANVSYYWIILFFTHPNGLKKPNNKGKKEAEKEKKLFVSENNIKKKFAIKNL